MGNHGQHEVLDGDKSKEYVEDWKIGGIRNVRGVCVEEGETVVGSTGQHTQRYVRAVPAALSRDGVKTWTKSARNPILAGEPAGVKVTGFRDPYVTELPLIPYYGERKSSVRGPVLYGLVSGGIQDRGPTVFLYETHRDDAEQEWTCHGALVDLPADSSCRRSGLATTVSTGSVPTWWHCEQIPRFDTF